MYGLALALWMIDIHNVITEMQVMDQLSSGDSLEDIYSAAISKILRLLSIEDVLYAYMVCCQVSYLHSLPHGLRCTTDGHW